MGIFKKIFSLFSAQSYVQRAMEEIEKKNQRYLPMTAEELLALSDEELCSAAIYRMDIRINNRFGEQREVPASTWVAFLSPAQRTAYCIDWLVGSSLGMGGMRESLFDGHSDWAPVFAPIASQCLEDIHAQEHKKLWDDLITAQHLELSALSHSKMPSPADDHGAFEAFDKALAKLPSLDPLLAEYVRQNIQEF